MTAESFQTVDITETGAELSRLSRLVAQTRGRVEIAADNGESCVMISKTELESLERALELLSDTECVREMHSAVAHLAREAAAT